MSESNITEVCATGIFTKQLQNIAWLPSSYWDSEDCVWQHRPGNVSSQKCAVIRRNHSQGNSIRETGADTQDSEFQDHMKTLISIRNELRGQYRQKTKAARSQQEGSHFSWYNELGNSSQGVVISEDGWAAFDISHYTHRSRWRVPHLTCSSFRDTWEQTVASIIIIHLASEHTRKASKTKIKNK